MAVMKGGEDASSAAHSSSSEGTQRAALPFCVVGIGASAGGVEALQQLLQHVRKDCGMAFVIVLHMPAEHDSMLSEILDRCAAIPVMQIYDGAPIEPNRAYVLPASTDVRIERGALMLSQRTAAAGQQHSIDHFFLSLAECQGERAIGVLLSGSADDGTAGVQEIKAAGGITFAQDDTAKYTALPRSAIASGVIDFVLPADEIAHELGRISCHPFVSFKTTPEERDFLPDIEPVLEILHNHAGVDFGLYKRNTIARRIARRIVLHKLGCVADYAGVLRGNALECEALYQDILINVTSFFRNPAAFEVLKTVVFPWLTENRSRHDPVRIWTLGCSTGEEAYSLAIAFSEFAESTGRIIPLQVFATDLNAASVDRARLGTYARSALEGLSEERLRRYFVQLDGHFRVTKTIRDCCVFARHNAFSDPPFSRIDLVSCRNMLIYLGGELQQKVIPVMHYALRDTGFLWLGTSETIGSYRELFDLVHPQYKIYSKKGVANRPRIGSMSTPAALLAQDVTGNRAPEPAEAASDSQKDLDRLLAARYAPPSVLVTAELEILQYRGDTSLYIAPAPGKASLNLLKMVRDELVLGVREAVRAARAQEAPSRQEDLRFSIEKVERRVNVEVIPIKSGVQRAHQFMVIFEDAKLGEPRGKRAPSDQTKDESSPAVSEVERFQQELAATREYLQSVIEQQEAANEELQSANEEIQSTNEELQSINEELETSKEEVQSSNEELATVNDELHSRNAELRQTNNDLVNLLASVQMAIVMLGPDLRIRRFTPMAEKLLNLIPTDAGRPLSDITWNFDVPRLHTIVEEVFDSMSPREREVRDKDGRWYLLRVRPYRTLENKIDGAVIVFVDIDGLKASQEALRQQTELLDQAHEPIIMWEVDGDIIYWNKAAEETYGFTREQAIGRKLHELLMISPALETFIDQLKSVRHWTGEVVHTRRNAQKIIVESRMVVVDDAKGRKLVVETNRPITERKASEGVLRRLADDLVTADRNKDEFLAMLGHELRNPLAPLRNVVSLLKSPAASTEDKDKSLEIMERQIGHMSRLIDDLLDVSRITLSQIELRRERLDVIEAIRASIDHNLAYFEAREQRLHVSLPRDPVHIDADPDRFEQIIGNLLHNASKYTQRGGEVTVTLDEGAINDARRTKSGEREAVIRVTDNGIGIAPDKLAAVFDMFMRANRAIDQEHGGLGLGLTLVRRLVELHGGRVEAHSAGIGVGSEFVVRLPTASVITADAVAEQDIEPAPVPDAMRVLVVDDNVDNCESIGMVLKLAGHVVATASQAAHALEVLSEFRPEVMLVDLSMPDISGYDLVKRMREKRQGNGVVLVAMSGYGQDEAMKRAREAGFDDYVVKPVSMDALNRALAGRSLRWAK